MSATFIATPSLPVVTLSATAAFVGTAAEFDLPVVTLSATLDSNWIRGEPLLPSIQLTAEMQAGGGFTAEFNLLAASVSAVLLQEAVFSGAPNLPRTQLSAQFDPGTILTGAPELPVLTLLAQLRSDAQFTAEFDLPPIQLSASLITAIAAAYRTWALNLHKNALTEYDNFDFNSYASFNGQVLACGSGGVVVLGTQALDGAAEIDAVARTGMADFDFSGHKRVPRLYVDGAQSGDMHFKAITVEGGSRTYLLPWNHVSGHTQRRVPVGKGPRSRFWQFEINNVAGADFSTKSLMAFPTKLRRRVS